MNAAWVVWRITGGEDTADLTIGCVQKLKLEWETLPLLKHLNNTGGDTLSLLAGKKWTLCTFRRWGCKSVTIFPNSQVVGALSQIILFLHDTITSGGGTQSQPRVAWHHTQILYCQLWGWLKNVGVERRVVGICGWWGSLNVMQFNKYVYC